MFIINKVSCWLDWRGLQTGKIAPGTIYQGLKWAETIRIFTLDQSNSHLCFFNKDTHWGMLVSTLVSNQSVAVLQHQLWDIQPPTYQSLVTLTAHEKERNSGSISVVADPATYTTASLCFDGQADASQEIRQHKESRRHSLPPEKGSAWCGTPQHSMLTLLTW